MPNYARAYVPGGTFFLTLVTHRRRPLFRRSAAVDCVRDALRQVRRERPFEVVAGVVLPDHLHLLWTLPPGDADFSSRVGRMKAMLQFVGWNSSHRFLHGRPAWWVETRLANYGLASDYAVSVEVVQTPGTLALTPGSATLELGGTQQFTAVVKDQFGDAVDDPAVTWTADHGAIDADGLYTATGGTENDTVHAKIGSSLSADADITVTISAPTGLSGDAPNEHEANLTWADTTTGETGFLIEQSDAGTDNFVPYFTTPPNATGWSVVGLSAGKSYDFRVSALAGELQSDPATATVQTPGTPDAEGVVIEWADGHSSGNVNDHPSGSALIRNLIVGRDYHIVIGFVATGAWDGSGSPRHVGEEATVGPDTFSLHWNQQEISHGTIVSSGNVEYYGAGNADYVDGPPAYEEDFSATSTTATVTVNTDGVDVDPYNDEGWQASVSITDTTEPVPPTVSIAPADEDGSAQAWEVPLGNEGDKDNKLKFTVTRSGNEEDGDFGDSLPVKIHPPAGLAIEGEDYDGAPLTVTIPAGSDHKTFTVTANGSLNTEVDKDLAICLKASEFYGLAPQYVAFGTFSPVGIVVSELSFDATDHAMFNQIIQDGHIDAQGLPDPAAAFGSVQWKDVNADGDADDSGDVDYPLAYTRSGINGQTVTAKVSATFSTQLPNGSPVMVRAAGPTLFDGNKLDFGAVAASAQGGQVVVTLTADHPIPSSIDKEARAIDWDVSVDGGQTWANGGHTSNTLYVSNVDLTQPVVETVIDIGCRNAVGATSLSEVAFDTWKDFKTPVPGVLREDKFQMKYWGAVSGVNTNATSATNPEYFSYGGLIMNADGRCNSWAQLLVATLAVQGVSSNQIDVTPSGNGAPLIRAYPTTAEAA